MTLLLLLLIELVKHNTRKLKIGGISMKSISKNKNKRLKNEAIIKAVYGDNVFEVVTIAAETFVEQINMEYPDYHHWQAACQRQENAILFALTKNARKQFSRQQKDNIGRKLFNKKYAPIKFRVRRAKKQKLIEILHNRIYNAIIKDVEFYRSNITQEALMYYNGHVYSITQNRWIK